MKNIKGKVSKISGSIRNYDTKIVAVAVNINADILTEVIERLEKLEEDSYTRRCEEAAERI